MEEQLNSLHQEIENLKKLNAEQGQMIAILNHNQNNLADVIDGTVSSVNEAMRSFVTSYATSLDKQEQKHHGEIKSQHEKWYQQYQEKIQNNQLFWTGLLTVVLLGMFTFLASITDSHTRTIVDTEIKRIEFRVDVLKESLATSVSNFSKEHR